MTVSFLIEENEGIAKFLEGDDTCVPISEYRYLHDRPLLRPTFLTQIDELTGKVAEKIVKNNLKTGVPTDKLTKLAITIGQNLGGDMDDEKARNILFALREIYHITKDLDGKLK